MGSIIGGVSGVGTKQETNNRSYVVINYKSSQDINEIKALSLEIIGATMHLGAFLDKLIDLMPRQKEELPKDGYL